MPPTSAPRLYTTPALSGLLSTVHGSPKVAFAAVQHTLSRTLPASLPTPNPWSSLPGARLLFLRPQASSMMHEAPTLLTPTLMSVYSTLQTLDHLRATCMMHDHPSTNRRRHAHCDIWTVTSHQRTHSPSHGQRSPLRPQRGAMHTLASSLESSHTYHTYSD